MGNMQEVFKKILSDENLTKEFSEKETPEELYELCKSIDERCTEEEFDEFVFNALETADSESYSDKQPLDIENLDNVAGGVNLGDTLKKGVALSLASLSVFSGMAVANQSFAANNKSVAGVSQSKKVEISKFKKVKDFFKNHKFGVRVAVGAVVLAAAAYGIYRYQKSHKSPVNIDKEIIARAQLFEKLTGVSEEYFRSHPEIIKKCIVKEPNGEFSIVNSKTGEKFKAGKFQEYSIGELDRRIASMPKSRENKKGKISVISLSEQGANHDAKKKVDVGDMQIDPANKGALFGVASNFHALETLSGSDSTSDKEINDYINDHTQGPFASMSAMAGLILRTYGHYYDEKTSPATWKQTDEKQVNLLGGLQVRTANGYVVENSHSLSQKLAAKGAKQRFKIGYHKNISAVGGYSFNDFNQEYVHSPDQVVDQAFCAALNLDGRDSLGSYAPTPENKESAKKILEWTYEGILKAAYVEGKKKVVLPLIGCGVFDNDPSWIAEALEKQKSFIKQSGMEVEVNLYSQEVSAQYNRTAKKACEKFREIADSYSLIDASGNVTSGK